MSVQIMVLLVSRYFQNACTMIAATSTQCNVRLPTFDLENFWFPCSFVSFTHEIDLCFIFAAISEENMETIHISSLKLPLFFLKNSKQEKYVTCNLIKKMHIDHSYGRKIIYLVWNIFIGYYVCMEYCRIWPDFVTKYKIIAYS